MIRRSIRSLALAYAASMVIGTGAAIADPLLILTWAFDHANGVWDSVNSEYNVSHTVSTSGYVSRHVQQTGQADLSWSDPGIGSASLEANLTLSNIQALTAQGSGTFTLVDVDGSSITATVEGTWSRVNTASSSATFMGSLTNISINGPEFNGTSGDDLDLVFSLFGYPPNRLIGSLVELKSSGGWFTGSSYSTSSVQVSGDISIIPAPAAAVLLPLGVGLVGWLKRRLT